VTDLVFALEHQEVRIVQADGLDTDQNLTRSRSVAFNLLDPVVSRRSI
jgi:hypothetical protein